MVLQYTATFQMACAFCFAIQTYVQLVHFHQSISHEIRIFFRWFIIIYPIIMTTILIILSARFSAVKPKRMICDVIDPVWIRIFGFSGLNQLYSIPGTFFSGRAAYEVYKHLDLFKSSSNSASEHVIDHDNIHQQRNTSRDHFSTQNKAYSLTRDAAIRMVVFSFLFALINFFACIPNFIDIINGVRIEKEPTSTDWVASAIGIFVFLVFGWPYNFQNVKKLWLG
ncbi:hypothetical protein C2G38_2147349 [Gigaspora rosea]|uniref:Uncharacterized protein n=1 Tax=Gigaspora rosea TaxID=44941 RepID=A0A397UFF4_9GLOM|nr:hypothetical protein C2G38_2147349 [Gigaspora rosea]